MPGLNLPSPLEKIEDDFLSDRGITLYLKRDDLIEEEISGNKWRKIKYNLEEFFQRGDERILTFGGAYSNHIRAVAAAGKNFAFKTIGVIRGDEFETLNPSLSFAKECGMELHFITREGYKSKNDPEFIKSLKKRFGDFYLLPEGGSNKFALQGCAEIVEEITENFDLICCPCGTGGTLAGIIKGLNGKNKALGFAALKGADFLKTDIEKLLQEVTPEKYENWEINTDYHFGGYAKHNAALFQFVEEFHQHYGVKLDYIYNAKMMYGLFDLIKNHDRFEGKKIIAVITGGLKNASTFN